jgi:hypothetical protein
MDHKPVPKSTQKSWETVTLESDEQELLPDRHAGGC